MDKIKLVIANEKLIVNGHDVDLPHPPEQAFVYHDCIVVRVDVPVDVILDRNVFGVACHGDILWQIEESPHGTEEDKPYMSIYLSEADRLVASNWNGVEYYVSPGDGKISVAAVPK